MGEAAQGDRQEITIFKSRALFNAWNYRGVGLISEKVFTTEQLSLQSSDTLK